MKPLKFATLTLGTLFAAAGMALATNPQPAILTTIASSNTAVIFPDPVGSPSTQKFPPLPAGAFPQGVSFYGSDNAIIVDAFNSRAFVVQISTAALLDTIDTTAVGYDGTGTVAVAPSLTEALAMGSAAGDNKKLYVIHAPFAAGSVITSVTLPGAIEGLETEAIVFNPAGRAFVETTAGISVLDPPYTQIAFNMPAVSGSTNGGALAITQDGNTLLATAFDSNVRIYQAPYSASSVPVLRFVPGNAGLDGIAITPDGTKAIVVPSNPNETIRASSISGPFSATSDVEVLPLPAGTNGFEDVGISADGQLAILAGNGAEMTTEEPIFVRAPFTAAGAQAFAVPVENVNPNRGNGAARFMPPGLAPGLTIHATAAATAALGTNFTFTLNYANTGTTAESAVVIRTPVPTGTIFVSASNGGTMSNGFVTYNLGALAGGGAARTVTFTVNLASSARPVVNENNYTIAATGVPPIYGPPLSVSITGISGLPSELLNISTRLNVLTNDNVLIGGFIITGTGSKQVVIRGLGPSLTKAGVTGVLADPVLQLHNQTGATIAMNDNWKQNNLTDQNTIVTNGLNMYAGSVINDLESVIVANLAPGAYTAIVSGNTGDTGVGLVEAYDLDGTGTSHLVNLSTRGFVGTGDDVLIGGVIVGTRSGGSPTVVVRAIGPSLAGVGVTGVLQDPSLELHDSNGAIIATNDNWRDGQQDQLIVDQLAPTDDRESAIEITLAPGAYTAIVSGVGGTTGVALVEFYNLQPNNL
ncbi:MAG: hypothetical protein ABI217_00995 [Chthoniobacterales bacterium]